MAKKKARGRAGLKNLQRNPDYIINQAGVKISNEEARQLRNLVARVNRKANKMESEFKGQPLFYGSRQLEENREQLKLMGEEMDIMIRKRSASLQQFQSKKAFNAYMKSLERAADTDYLDYRGKLYKRNLITAIKREYAEYPELVKGVTMRIQMMPQDKFQKMIGTNRAMQIKFQYDSEHRLQRLLDMRDSLGLTSDLDDYQ